MEDTTWQEILDRLFKATHSTNETALASRLGISSQSVYNARNKKQIPPGWIYEVAKNFHVSADWLFFGREPMYPGRIADPAAQNSWETPTPKPPAESCLHYTELETELKLERTERRELSRENRKLSAKNEQLLLENGELRARCATLEERQKHLNIKQDIDSGITTP